VLSSLLFPSFLLCVVRNRVAADRDPVAADRDPVAADRDPVAAENICI